MPRLRAEELTEMVVLPIINEVSEENWARFRSVPIRRNSVFDGFRQSLFWFIQDRMSLNEDVKMLTESKSESGVKEM